MNRSYDHILVSHAGNLPRPPALHELMAEGPAAREAFNKALPASVAEVVRRQAAIGIDIVNDGELSKVGGFSNYVSERLSGLEQRTSDLPPMNVSGRDRRDFPGFYAAGMGGFGASRRIPGTRPPEEAVFCVGPVKYIGEANAQADIQNFKA